MSVWTWVIDYQQEVLADPNPDRSRMAALYQEALDHQESDPDLALRLLSEGRRLAQTLDEPRWVLFYEHWTLQVLLFHADDYRRVRDLAVRSTLEASKPQHADLPQRICLHEDLIYAHVGIDPVGFADDIEKALAYMGKEITDDLECRNCLQGCRTIFEFGRGDLDAAERSGLMELEIADAYGRDHYIAEACNHLCRVAAARADFEALDRWADLGTATARAAGREREMADFRMWQAVALRGLGEEEEAQRSYRRARSRMKNLAQPSDAFVDGRRLYHEMAEDLETALRVVEREIHRLEGRGRFHRLARLHLERCRLHRDLASATPQHFQAARAAIEMLRRPEAERAELRQLED